MAPLIRNLKTKRTCAMTLTPRPVYSNGALVPTDLAGPRAGRNALEKKQKYFLPTCNRNTISRTQTP
jgi:hypothetical protein